MARVTYRSRWRLGDGRSLLVLMLVAGAASAFLGWAINRDADAALAARSGRAAGVLARTIQGLPGGDWEVRKDAMTRLARALGPSVQVAVVEGTATLDRPFSGDRGYAAHSDPMRVGQRLESRRLDDAQLLRRLHAWHGRRTDAVELFQQEDGAGAFVVSADPPVAVSVTGVVPPGGQRRGWAIGGCAFLVVMVLGGAIIGGARRVGPVLVLPVMAVTLWLAAALATAVGETLWTGRLWRPACRAVAETGFPAASRELCEALPVASSWVAQITIPTVAEASGSYLLFLLWRLVRAWLRRRREAALARLGQAVEG